MVRVLGDVDLAEDAVADAFAVAAQRWPEGPASRPTRAGGSHDRPQPGYRPVAARGARTDRHRAAQRMRSRQGPRDNPELDEFGDPRRRRPTTSSGSCSCAATRRCNADAQVALTLRLLGGLDTPEIARAFLVPEATLAQRLVRAKRKLRDNHDPYRVPRGAELPGGCRRCSPRSTSSTRGPHRERRATASAAPTSPPKRSGSPGCSSSSCRTRRGRGLLALMLLTEARRPARVAADGSLCGSPTRTAPGGTGRSIAEGHDLVRVCLRRDQPGPYQVQAAIAAVHADAATAADTDWWQIVALYDQLHAMRPNAVVALNRAVAVAELRRPRGRAGRARRRSTRRRWTGTSRSTPPGPSCWPVRVDRGRAPLDRASSSANPAERRFLERQRGALTDDAQRPQPLSTRRGRSDRSGRRRSTSRTPAPPRRWRSAGDLGSTRRTCPTLPRRRWR